MLSSSSEDVSGPTFNLSQIHLFYFMCVNVLSAFISVHHCQVPEEVRGEVESPGTGAMGGCEIPAGFWESNLGLLQEQHRALNG